MPKATKLIMDRHNCFVFNNLSIFVMLNSLLYLFRAVTYQGGYNLGFRHDQGGGAQKEWVAAGSDPDR